MDLALRASQLGAAREKSLMLPKGVYARVPEGADDVHLSWGGGMMSKNPRAEIGKV